MALFHFETNLIEWRFFLFSNHFEQLANFFQLPCLDKNMSLPRNLVPRIPSFYIRTKSRLKTRVTKNSSREKQTRVIKTKVYYKLFYSVWKETSHKSLKVAAAKKSFPSVYIIDKTYFDQCFLVHVINLTLQISRAPEVWCNHHVATCFKTFPFYIHCLH